MRMNKIQSSRAPASWRGFSLIELMVVVAVMGILATIAVNSYRRYTLRATRTEGRLALLAIQVAQEKYFLQNNTYAQDIATVTAAPPGGLGISSINASGVTTGGNYTISFAAVTPTTYTLQAVATGAQTKDTGCLTFTITDQGARTPVDSSGCWR
jgi:type IV pilus assembly protein PilE